MYVAVPEDRDEQFVRVFGTFTRKFYCLLAQWAQRLPHHHRCHGIHWCLLDTSLWNPRRTRLWCPVGSMLVNQDVLRSKKPISKTANGFSNCTPTVFCMVSFIPEQNSVGSAARVWLSSQSNLPALPRFTCSTYPIKILHSMNLKLTNVISDDYGTHRHAYSCVQLWKENRSCIFSIIPWSSLKKSQSTQIELFSPRQLQSRIYAFNSSKYSISMTIILHSLHNSMPTPKQCTRNCFAHQPKRTPSQTIKA